MSAPSARAPALDPASLPARTGTSYPPPYDQAVKGRARRVLGEAAGLTQFGVNLTTLAPGAQSAQAHWHSQEDEFVFVVSGELVLVAGDDEQMLSAGMCAGFPAGTPLGHCLVNRSDRPASYLEVGTRAADDEVVYPDCDMQARTEGGRRVFRRKSGAPIR